jgi:hypothetical protein
VAESDLAKAEFPLLEFDRLSQTPNDASSIEYRLKVMKEFLKWPAPVAVAPKQTSRVSTSGSKKSES